VHDVGRVSDADRARWLARAAVLCLPSFSESFGLVVAEAWSQAVPVIVADIPVLRELVTDSGGGLVVDPDSASFAAALTSLLDDPERARKLGAAGQDYWRRQLTPEAVAERHLDIYQRIIRERSG
jgi:glycosyltransferase involved in cell wall biosynthesis